MNEFSEFNSLDPNLTSGNKPGSNLGAYILTLIVGIGAGVLIYHIVNKNKDKEEE